MWEIIITSSVLISGLALLRRVCQGKISSRLQYSLWLLVAVRLLVPIPVFGNRFSVMNVVSRMTGEQAEDRGIWTVEMVSGAQGDGLPEVVEGTKTEVGRGAKAEKAANRRGAEGEKEAANGRGAKGEEGANGREGEEAPNGKGAGEEAANGRGEEGEEAVNVTETKEAEKGSKAGKYCKTAAEESQGKDLQSRENGYAQFVWADMTSVYSLLRVVWVTGMVVMTAWMLACNLFFRRRLRRERRFLYRRGRLRVYEAASLDSPCLYGVFAPAVYLNQDSLLKPCYREHALAHEMTHYRHGDPLWTVVRNLCLVIYWFHPLVWLAVSLSVRDCELACDEGTLRRLGEEQREAYGRTLIEIAYAASRKMRFLQFAEELSCGKRELKERIASIASGKKSPGGSGGGMCRGACGVQHWRSQRGKNGTVCGGFRSMS